MLLTLQGEEAAFQPSDPPSGVFSVCVGDGVRTLCPDEKLRVDAKG